MSSSLHSSSYLPLHSTERSCRALHYGRRLEPGFGRAACSAGVAFMIAASAASVSWADEASLVEVSSAEGSASSSSASASVASDGSAPVFDQYEAATNTFSGFAPAGSVVAIAASDGSLLGEAYVSDAGSFWFTLPADVYLGDVSVYVEDGQGGAEGDVLTGASMVAALAERTGSSVLSAVGDSTSDLASSFVGSTAALASDLAVDETAVDESLPVVPYALGAASALVAAAAVGGSLLLARKFGKPSGQSYPDGARPATGGHFESSRESFTPSGPRPAGVSSRADDAPRDSGDELESLAMSLFGTVSPATSPDSSASSAPSASVMSVGGSSGVRPVDDDSEDTVSFSAVERPSDPEDFARVARILASGSGAVHRVTAVRLDADLSGLDRFDGAGTSDDTSVANPLLPSDDWRAVAFAELADERPSSPSGADAGSATLPRRQTKPFTAPAAVSTAPARSQGAPVVGPRFMTPDDAAMRRQALEQSDAPEAKELRRRDRLFQAQKAGRLARSKSSRDSEEDGVPVISRGSSYPAAPGPAMRSHYIGDSARETSRSVSVPDPELILPVAATLSSESSVAPSVAVAASAAQIAYAAFAGTGSTATQKKTSPATGDRPAVAQPSRAATYGYGSAGCGSAYSDARSASSCRPTAPSGDDDHSIAAAYAAAVYSAFGAGTPVPETATERGLSSVPSVGPEESLGRSGSGDAYATSPLSPAYIEHMVRDEFAHRHDTPAQRNAALGRIRIVNGAACAPVSVREGVAMKRYMA